MEVFLVIHFACENEVHKTERRLKKMFYMESISEAVCGGKGLSFMGTIMHVQEVSIFIFTSFFQAAVSC